MRDRADLLARISGLEDDELERVVELLDAGVFSSDPLIFEHIEFPEDDPLSKEERKRRRWEAIALIPALLDNEAFHQLQREVRAKRQRVFERYARVLASSSTPLDQREIDHTRGFWDGALYATYRLPATIEKARIRRVLSQPQEGVED